MSQIWVWQFLFRGIRFCDIETQSDPDHLLITLIGKTGYRKSATMPEAVDILHKVKEMYPDASPTDYVFMPQYPNRTTALNTYRRIFNLRWRDPMGISLKPRQGQIGMRKSMPPKWQGPCFSRSVH